MVLVALISPAWAQVAQQPDYRRFFRKPEKPLEHWAAVRFFVEIGKFDQAATAIKDFLASKPSDEELLQIEEKEGLSTFLRLRNVPRWSSDTKEEQVVRQDIEELIERVTTALKNVLTDPKRITKFVQNLSASREEQTYAIQQLRRSGAAAVPYLIDTLRQAEPGSATRVAILYALPKLAPSSVPPLAAALSIDDPVIQYDLLEVLRKQGAKSAAPYLWHLAASPREPDMVRREAKDVLAYFLNVPADKLPAAKAALTEEAKRYYYHRVNFQSDPQAVTVWRWDGRRLVGDVMTATQAEEYHGLFFARQALDLDPGYQPAQVVFLSLALEKGFERAGLAQPLAQGAPEVKDLASSVNPELLSAVLEQALADRRLPVVLAAVRTLGELADTRALRPRTELEPPLVRALNYPERRVQMAAAAALLRAPGSDHPPGSARVVEVLRRNLAAEVKPKALVADFNKDRAQALVQLLRQAGYDVGADETVQTGRELLQRLARSADIDVVLIDQAIPDTEITHLIPQIRADVFSGRVPIVITVAPDRKGPLPLELERKLNRLAERYPLVTVIRTPRDAESLKALLAEKIQQAHGAAFSEAERKGFLFEALVWLTRMARGELRGYDIRPAEREILAALRSDELAPLAIAAAGKLSSAVAQRELARVVLDSERNPQLRTAAAYELTHHLQEHNLALSRDQMKGLADLYNGLTGEGTRELRSAVALVIGGMRPEPRVTGQRLQGYVPPPPAPPEKEGAKKGGKPPEEKKEGEKPKEEEKPEESKGKKAEGK
jgi:CheY-like chemotaxis protein